MADVHSKEIRRYNLSRVKGKNAKPEIMERKPRRRLSKFH